MGRRCTENCTGSDIPSSEKGKTHAFYLSGLQRPIDNYAIYISKGMTSDVNEATTIRGCDPRGRGQVYWPLAPYHWV